MYLSLPLSLYLYLSLPLSCFGQVMCPHHSDKMSQRSQVSGMTLLRYFNFCFVFVIVYVVVFVFVFVFVLFLGQIMSSHHSDHLSQRSQVSGIAPFRCSLNVFVFVDFLVFFFVFVFVVFFLGIRLCLLITLIKCLKGHKSLGLLF